jgi:urate oxidase
MAIVLGPNQYGKADVRLVHIDRSTAVHQIKDVNVTSQLMGDFSATHARATTAA